jgi:ribosomal protein S18 acetylase RimI-like enzyme
MSERVYPDEPADSFPAPPIEFTDGDDREIVIEAGGRENFEDLVEMYEAFDPADRAQGIPPVQGAAIREWLENLLVEDSVNVVAGHGDSLVGHAILVPDVQEAYELAVFVLRAYQGAGIGTRLIEALLGHGQEADVEKVWLTVERWNDPAISLYRKVGFETASSESFELEMSIRLGE